MLHLPMLAVMRELSDIWNALFTKPTIAQIQKMAHVHLSGMNAKILRLDFLFSPWSE